MRVGKKRKPSGHQKQIQFFTILFGTVMVLTGSIMLLPALLQLFGRGQPVLGTLVAEPDEEI